MRLTTLCVAGLMAAMAMAGGAAADSGREPVVLWTQGAPGALGAEEKDIPTITPYLVDEETTRSACAAVLVCPGGGYHSLAPHEGGAYARWLNEQGIQAFVLKYRLASGGYRHPAMMQDAARAMRTIRARAGEWRVDPRRVGIMGSSAGGHLASTILTHFDNGDTDSTDTVEHQGCRPDFGILCYPVISMGINGHKGSALNLLGDNPPADLVEYLSSELQVTKDTPPTFLFHTSDDAGVPVENSLMFASALARANVPFALHVYPHGAHGLGLGTREWNPAGRHAWTTQCALWLREQGFARQ